MQTTEQTGYRQLQKIDDGLWIVDDRWKRSPMDRRMTVMAVGDGCLAVHNAIVLDDEQMRALNALGTVAFILVPNVFHGSEAGEFAELYPEAKLLIPAGGVAKFRSRYPRIDGTLEADWPEELDRFLKRESMRGMRLHEVVFFHVATRTLVLTDMCMNLPDRYRGLTRWFLRWNGIVENFAASKLARYWFFKDKGALGESMSRVLVDWDFDRVIINHGDILESGGKTKLREVFAFLPKCGGCAENSRG